MGIPGIDPGVAFPTHGYQSSETIREQQTAVDEIRAREREDERTEDNARQDRIEEERIREEIRKIEEDKGRFVDETV